MGFNSGLIWLIQVDRQWGFGRPPDNWGLVLAASRQAAVRKARAWALTRGYGDGNPPVARQEDYYGNNILATPIYPFS